MLFPERRLPEPKPRRPGLGTLASFALHLAIASLVFLVPVLAPSVLPQGTPVVPVGPPPGPGAPPLLGHAAGAAARRRRPRPPSQTPREIPVNLEAPLPPDPVDPTPPTADAGIGSGRPDGTDGGTGDTPGGERAGVGGPGTCVGPLCGAGVVRDADEPPRILTQARPVYPDPDFIVRREGTVVVGAIVDQTGHVAQVWVIRGCSATMDAAALVAVRQWTFTPARRHGQPVAVEITAPVKFGIY